MIPLELSVEPRKIFWRNLTDAGETSWFDIQSLITRVGHDPSFAYLVIHEEDGPGLPGTFAQCTGGGKDVDLLIEVGYGDTVGIVAPIGAGSEQHVWITQDEPWCRTSADPRVLLPVAAMAPLAFSWITHGSLDPALELRCVEDYELPRYISR